MATGIVLLTAGIILGRMSKKTLSHTKDTSTRAGQAMTSTSTDGRVNVTAPPAIEMTENAAYGIVQVTMHGQEDEAQREESSMYCEVKDLP